MKRLVSLWCVCLFVASLRVVAAQTYQGAIRGQVRDQNGVIPGAEIVLLNEGTLTSRTIVTNDVGEYAFTGLDVGGPYRVTATLDGFKPSEVGGIFLSAGKTRDVKLVLIASVWSLSALVALGRFDERRPVS